MKQELIERLQEKVASAKRKLKTAEETLELVESANPEFVVEAFDLWNGDWEDLRQLDALNELVNEARIKFITTALNDMCENTFNAIFIASDAEAFKVMKDGIDFLEDIHQ